MSSPEIKKEHEIKLVKRKEMAIFGVCEVISFDDESVRLMSVEGEICGREVSCHIESVDTLHQVVHRVPRRFLGIPYGTKAIRQEITSSNPHTTVVYSEYIDLRRRRCGR